MLRNLIGLLVVLVMAVLLASPVASAQSCTARPGQSAIEQYCESVPAPGGNRGDETDDDSAAGRKRETPGAQLSPGARRSSEALARAGGADEQDLNRFLNAPDNQTAASPSAAPRTGGRDAGSDAPRRSGKNAPESPATSQIERSSTRPEDVGGVAVAVGASSSSGTKLLAVVAAVALLAGMSVLLLRRRRRQLG